MTTGAVPTGPLRAGLTSAEAAARLASDGPNKLPPPPAPHTWRKLIAQFSHFFALMLWAAGVLAVIAGMPQLGPVARLLDQAFPPLPAFVVAVLAAPLVLVVDHVHKRVRAKQHAAAHLAR